MDDLFLQKSGEDVLCSFGVHYGKYRSYTSNQALERSWLKHRHQERNLFLIFGIEMHIPSFEVTSMEWGCIILAELPDDSFIPLNIQHVHTRRALSEISILKSEPHMYTL